LGLKPLENLFYTGTDLRSAGPQAILVFGVPLKCDLFGRLSEKREIMPLLCVVPSQKSLLLWRLWFSNCLRSSTEIKAFLTFFQRTNGIAICSWNL